MLSAPLPYRGEKSDNIETQFVFLPLTDLKFFFNSIRSYVILSRDVG